SGMYRKKNPSSAGALITKRYHMIEKGMALPQPRPGFGEVNVRELCSLTTKSLRSGIALNEVSCAADALEAYKEFNLSTSIQPQAWVTSAINDVRMAGISRKSAAVRELEKLSMDGANRLELLMSRVSVRDFSEGSVPSIVLKNAVRAAQQAPSVCNRQA